MLRLALLEAKKIGLEKVLITCLDDNIASAKVIENNGGVFERLAERREKISEVLDYSVAALKKGLESIQLWDLELVYLLLWVH